MTDRLKTIVGHLTQGTSQKNVFEETSLVQDVGGYTNNLRYTLDQPKLSQEQRQFYEKNGFLVIKNLVPQGDLDRYRDRFERICKQDIKVPGLTIMRDVSILKSEFVPGQKAITKIQEFQNDEVLFEYCKHPKVLEYVECFTGPNIMAMHTMLINKPPDSGQKSSRHPMHQDLYYFPFRPAERIVCSWTAMEHVHRQNGCLVVLPGSHQGALLEHGYPEWEGGVNKMYHGIKDYKPSYERVHLEMAPGDTVFFHPLLIHGSGTNRTQGFRKSISCHFSSGDMTFINVEEGHVQTTIADEVRDVACKQLGVSRDQIKFEDIWKFKGRLVQGADNSL